MRRSTLDDRYVLADPLGGGEMAVVYLAHDRVLDRDVALKVLREQYARDEEFVERFRREAVSAAALSHPNIVSVYDRGQTEDGRYYMVMEYVPGGTLKEHLNRYGPLAPRVAIEVGSQIAEALGAAHDRGVIHRDVKPQNILVSKSGDVKVADFGIARAASATAISQTEDMLGTARYMSPEQAMGGHVGPASDLYSLGVVLHEMLTGEVPFDAEMPVAISMKHINEPPRPPREINPEIPEGMNALVLRLLAKEPENRYTSAADLLADLDEAGRMLEGSDSEEVKVEKEAQTREVLTETEKELGSPRRKSRVAVVLVVLLVFLVAIGGFGLGSLWTRDGISPSGPSSAKVTEAVQSVFIQRATSKNISANSTYIDNRRTNGNPDAVLSVTQSWNPGGGDGTYNDHPVGVWYDRSRGRWAIFNQDRASMARGAAFNVVVLSTGSPTNGEG